MLIQTRVALDEPHLLPTSFVSKLAPLPNTANALFKLLLLTLECSNVILRIPFFPSHAITLGFRISRRFEYLLMVTFVTCCMSILCYFPAQLNLTQHTIMYLPGQRYTEHWKILISTGYIWSLVNIDVLHKHWKSFHFGKGPPPTLQLLASKAGPFSLNAFGLVHLYRIDEQMKSSKQGIAQRPRVHLNVFTCTLDESREIEIHTIQIRIRKYVYFLH